MDHRVGLGAQEGCTNPACHLAAANLAASYGPAPDPDHRGGKLAVIAGGLLAGSAKAAEKGADLKPMQALDPDLVEQESLLLGSILRHVVEGAARGRRARAPWPPRPTAGQGQRVLVIEYGGNRRVEPLG
jgi:hypothetical protein